MTPRCSPSPAAENPSPAPAWLDPTGSRLHGVVADLTGRVLERHSTEVDPALGVPALIDALARTARELSRHGPGELLGVGVGMPGPVDPVGGVHLVSSSSTEAWRGASVRDLLL